jgi:hypothetical protein
MGDEERYWRVPVRGSLPEEAKGRLSDAEISPFGKGTSFGAGGDPVAETQGLYVRAPSAEEAAARVERALEGFPVDVAADEVEPS